MSKHTPEPNRKCDWMIEDAIKRGLRCVDGQFVWPSGKTIKPTKCAAGYWRISLGPHTARRCFTVARVICWMMYGPPPSPSHMADHINRIRDDDRPENLRWASPSLNASNISEESRQRVRASHQRPRPVWVGELHPSSRFSDKQVLEMREAYASGVSQRRLAAKYGTCQGVISRIVTGRARKELGGFALRLARGEVRR